MKNRSKKDVGKATERETYGFTKVNLYVLIASLLLIGLGYLLMSGGASPDGVSFDPEVFSAVRIRIAPLICTLGYIGIVVAILWRKRSGYNRHDDELADQEGLEEETNKSKRNL